MFEVYCGAKPKLAMVAVKACETSGLFITNTLRIGYGQANYLRPSLGNNHLETYTKEIYQIPS